ncbi:hypothetical protein ABLB84_19685 [Xenorhabdus szentirmaii]
MGTGFLLAGMPPNWHKPPVSQPTLQRHYGKSISIIPLENGQFHGAVVEG